MKEKGNYFRTPFDTDTFDWHTPSHCSTEDLKFMSELTKMMFLATGCEKHLKKYGSSLSVVLLRENKMKNGI